MQVFDPYHVWLGIPPQDQPPNHYRLLGIPLFESHADVIATAADRQMGHLRTFQSGKHSNLSQRLLNEVATAKVCLLNADKKAVYDKQVRQQLEPPWAHPVLADALPAESPQWADDYAPPTAQTRRAARRRQASLGPMIGIAVAAVLSVAGLLAWNVTRQTDKSTVAAVAGQVHRPPPAPPKADAPQPVDKPASPPVVQSPPEEPAADVEPVAPSSPITPNPPEESAVANAASMTRPTFEKPTEVVENPADPPEKPAMPSFEVSADKPDQPVNTPVEKKRLPMPGEDVQQKIAAQISSVYNPSRAKTPAERTKLAYQLLQAAKASKEPNERYVLLHQGRELAGQAGDIALVLQVIEMTADFDIDVLDEKGKALLAFAEKANNADQIRALYGASQQAIAQALSGGRYELAADLANGVYRACQPPHGKDFRKKALDQRDWVREYCRRQAERQEAEANLKDNPDDAEAHLVLGRHYCSDDDWKSGLPHLAKGSDAELRQLAEQDVASLNEPAGQIKLADAWWTLAKNRQGEERDVLLLRAGYWYDRALRETVVWPRPPEGRKTPGRVGRSPPAPRRRPPAPPSGRKVVARPLERPILNVLACRCTAAP